VGLRGMSQPRTWTLPPSIAAREAVLGPDFTEPVEVIELDRVLGLLEELRSLVNLRPGAGGVLADVEAFLRSHGRLREPA
jgi:hypothetical protein